jgi:chitinase
VNKWIRISAIFLIVLFVQLPSALAAVTTEGSSGTTPWVTGYYVGYQRNMLPPEDIYWDGLTHIAMGAATANADGTLNTDFYIDDTNGPALARQISTLAHAHNKKAILMLGGADNGAAIHSAVSNHRAAFIANIVSTMDTLGYDGVDLDWEDDVDWVLFETFAKELRLAAPGKIITLPGGAINSNYQTVDPRVVNVTKYVDQFNLMTYYPATAWAGDGWYSWHNSPLKGAKSTTPVSIEDSLARYNASGVPKEKMGMGVGFYAIGYKGGITGPDQPTTNGVIVGGDNAYPLSKLYGTGGAYDERYRYWDGDALEPYLSLPQPDSFGAKYVSFEDQQSLIAKGAFARENGYGGIIIWTINEGYVASRADPNFLMEALRVGFIEPPATLPVVTFPGQTALPTDTDNDGLYEDLNGNGRLDFADVVLFFDQMDWITANEPLTAFDINGNSRIDFNDIVLLFGEI